MHGPEKPEDDCDEPDDPDATPLSTDIDPDDEITDPGDLSGE